MSKFKSTFLCKNKDHFIESVNAPNRALFFGDGIFETFIFSKGKIRFAEMHWERANEGCRVLGLNTQGLTSTKSMEEHLFSLFGNQNLRVRWSIYRAGLGKYTPESNELEEDLFVQEFISAPKTKNTTYFSQEVKILPSIWSHCKTLNALTYVMANRERKKLGMDEVILLNFQGYICEAGSSNIFWVKDKVFYTPSIATGCIAGIGRKVIIEHLKIQGRDIREGQYLPEDILKAQHVFTSNVTGLSHLLKVENQEYLPLEDNLLNHLF
jgi:4-amino-4-deoxychorismate lyase